MLTPEGKISRYIFGATFDARELRDALVAAREGESTSTLSKVFLLCYHYNPITGKYGALIMSIVRVAGVVTLLVITGFVALMVGRDRRARRALTKQSFAGRPGGPSVPITTRMDKFRLFPPQGSTMSHEVDALFFALIAVSLFFLAIIFLPIIFFSVKYRRGSKADRSHPSSGSLLLEGGWTMGAIVLGLGLFSWGAITYFRIERRPANAIDVQVVGKQWMWKLQHAEGKREINELHVPVNRTVVLTMTSQDVIHSFFVPAFRVKQDVVPGRYTSEWFKAIKPGEYHLFCAEYCGTQHSGMIGRVVVMEPRAYEEWLKTGEQTESIVLAGQRLFHDRGCSGCHSPNSKFHAPLLEGLYRKPVPLADGTMVRADDQYLRDSILQPAKQITAGYENIMPSFAGHLSEEEIMQLIAYVKAIGQQEPPAR